MVGYPGAAPGYSCFQGKRVLLALSYPMKSGRAPRTRTGLRGLANHWLDDFAVRTLEMVPSAGSAPAPLRSQRRMLRLHYEGSVEMDPPVGLRLLPLCIYCSAPHGLCAIAHGARAHMILFTRQVPSCVGHGGI